MLRENLEEEATVMKDVPGWKVGPQPPQGPGCCRNAASHRKSRALGEWCQKGEAVQGRGTGAARPGGVPAGS